MNVGCRGSSAAEAIPRWPALAATVRAREAEELAALLRDQPKLAADLVARYKPAPTGFKPSFDHLTNCTVCDNDRRWRASVRAAPLQQAPGAPQLLLDEAPLSDWASVVLELERPRKRRVGFVEASHTSAEPPRASRVKYHFGTGLPGTVLYEDGRFRAWVDQFRQTYHESTDGVRFFAKEGALEWLHPLPADPRAAAGGYRRAAKLLGGRAVAQSTLTVTRDEAAPAAERYKSAFNCIEEKSSNALGHDPRAVDPSLRAGGEWQSTCLGYSADGLHWRPYELQHERGEGPEGLRMASDTSNSIYYDQRRGVHRLVNRWNAPIPAGQYGTPRGNPNWWREIRGVRISANADLRADGTPRAWQEDATWYLDREGKGEHMRRQIYSLQVSPVASAGLFVGLLNVIEWGKRPEAAEEPPFAYDVMRTYLATSRDGGTKRASNDGWRIASSAFPASSCPGRVANVLPPSRLWQ